MKKIKKIIYVDKLTPAPLDNKNVMLDWWEENMFDDGSYAFSGNTYLGFIAGVPVMATVKRILSDTSRRLMATSTTAILEHSDSISAVTSRTNGILTKCARLLASIRIPSSLRSPKCSMCVTSISMMATSFLRTCIYYSADGLVSRWITATDFRRRILSSRAERQLRKEHVCVPETAQSS